MDLDLPPASSHAILVRVFIAGLLPPWVVLFAASWQAFIWAIPLAAWLSANRIYRNFLRWRALDPELPQEPFNNAVILGHMLGFASGWLFVRAFA